MDIFFGSIYSWFLSLYGDNLSYYLWGYDPATEAYTNTNIYNHIGLITLAITLAIVLVYYYIINHARFCKWWSWLLTLIVNSFIALGVGYGIIHAKYINGIIPQELVEELDADGNVVAYLITDADCLGFGMANMFVAAMAFIILSFILKWWSSNAKHVPFL